MFRKYISLQKTLNYTTKRSLTLNPLKFVLQRAGALKISTLSKILSSPPLLFTTAVGSIVALYYSNHAQHRAMQNYIQSDPEILDKITTLATKFPQYKKELSSIFHMDEQHLKNIKVYENQEGKVEGAMKLETKTYLRNPFVLAKEFFSKGPRHFTWVRGNADFFFPIVVGDHLYTLEVELDISKKSKSNKPELVNISKVAIEDMNPYFQNKIQGNIKPGNLDKMYVIEEGDVPFHMGGFSTFKSRDEFEFEMNVNSKRNIHLKR